MPKKKEREAGKTQPLNRLLLQRLKINLLPRVEATILTGFMCNKMRNVLEVWHWLKQSGQVQQKNLTKSQVYFMKQWLINDPEAVTLQMPYTSDA